MHEETLIADHYSRGDLLQAIADGVARAGKSVDRVAIEDLAPVDEFHIGGSVATRAFLDQVGISAEDHVLDIGCGAGLLSESVASLGAKVTGVDPAEHNIAIARSHAANSGLDINYLEGSVETLRDAMFDVVLNMEVVEHVDNLDLFMARCNELTRPGGMQFVATINRNPLSWLVAIVGAEYMLRWLPLGTHQWRKFVKPAEVAAMLRDGGFNVLASRGVSVNPLTRSYKVNGFTGVNYMVAARKKAPGC